MTHHNRRAYPPKQEPRQPWTTAEQATTDLFAAIEAARDALIEQMTNPRAPVYYMSPREYDHYLTLLQGKDPDPMFQVIEQDQG